MSKILYIMNRLLPSHYKWPGLLILIPSIIIGFANVEYDFEFAFLDFNLWRGAGFQRILNDNYVENWTNELAFLGILLGLTLISFSRSNVEDEGVHKIRSEAFMLAFKISLIFLVISNFFFFDFGFLLVLVYYSFMPLALFNIIFYIKLMLDRKGLGEDA